MSEIRIRGVDEDVKEQVKRVAAREDKSMSEWCRGIIHERLHSEQPSLSEENAELIAAKLADKVQFHVQYSENPIGGGSADIDIDGYDTSKEDIPDELRSEAHPEYLSRDATTAILDQHEYPEIDPQDIHPRERPQRPVDLPLATLRGSTGGIITREHAEKMMSGEHFSLGYQYSGDQLDDRINRIIQQCTEIMPVRGEDRRYALPGYEKKAVRTMWDRLEDIQEGKAEVLYRGSGSLEIDTTAKHVRAACGEIVMCLSELVEAVPDDAVPEEVPDPNSINPDELAESAADAINQKYKQKAKDAVVSLIIKQHETPIERSKIGRVLDGLLNRVPDWSELSGVDVETIDTKEELTEGFADEDDIRSLKLGEIPDKVQEKWMNDEIVVERDEVSEMVDKVIQNQSHTQN